LSRDCSCPFSAHLTTPHYCVWIRIVKGLLLSCLNHLTTPHYCTWTRMVKLALHGSNTHFLVHWFYDLHFQNSSRPPITLFVETTSCPSHWSLHLHPSPCHRSWYLLHLIYYCHSPAAFFYLLNLTIHLPPTGPGILISIDTYLYLLQYNTRIGSVQYLHQPKTSLPLVPLSCPSHYLSPIGPSLFSNRIPPSY
jgi:hypothetical protein